LIFIIKEDSQNLNNSKNRKNKMKKDLPHHIIQYIREANEERTISKRATACIH